MQQGEIGLTRSMLRASHSIPALFGHDHLGKALDPTMVRSFVPRFEEPRTYGRYSLNPTHRRWRALVEAFSFSYLKTERVLRNTGRLTSAEAWPGPVGAADLPLVQTHLAIMWGG